jgi:outer membrane protein OmpA-like peptidoglycan-associated protein
MRKLILSIFIGTTLTTSAQVTDFNKWSIGYSLGGHLWTKPSSSANANLQNFQISHHDLNGRYMFNNRLGIMLDVGYDFFDFRGLGGQNTHHIRTSIQSVVNIGDIIKLHTLHERFGLLLHAGVGYSGMWQKHPKETTTDDMANFIAGLTPQLRLSDHWSLKADASVIVNYKQDNTYDFLKKLNANNTINNTGLFFNLSLGVTYYIGKHKTHADWTPTVYGSTDKFDPTPLQNKIQELEEQLKDDDGDGVINSRDLEANTPKGVVVNSLGQEIKKPVDTDGDGFTDDVDECPKEYGRIYGCPDTDYDGIPDKDDECPKEHGKPENKGCPVSKETLDIIRKVSEAIYFNTGKSTIKAESFPELDKLANILNTNPDVAVSIEGHTDNQGNAAKNLQLSKDRAKAVKTYLTSKGVGSDRIKSEGYGSTRAVASNDTEEGRAQNRRVVINTSSFKQTLKVAP